MRIVGGEYKGRTLVEFKGEEVRPTADKVRESLYNILQNRIYGSRFLDLFAGTGAMGIEALSRGAREAVFNDSSKKSLEIVKKNLEKLKVDKPYSILNFDARRFLEINDKPFDIIYIDPPYKSGMGLSALNAVKNSLAEGGVVVYEEEEPFVGEALGLKIFDSRKYGRVHLTFFKREEEV